jgi:hypothetical protein
VLAHRQYPTTVIAGAANDTAAMPSAVRHTTQEARVSIVAPLREPGAVTVNMVMAMNVSGIGG